MHTTRDFGTEKQIAERKASMAAARASVDAILSEEMTEAREVWSDSWKAYEKAYEKSDKRYKIWTDAATNLKAANDLSVTAKVIQEARMAFKKYIMANAEINETFQEAYFTTRREAEFVRLRDDIEKASHAFSAAVRAHHFDAETIPEYYRWRIAQKRMRACWELTEVAMAEMETIANTGAMAKFAKTEGLQTETAEIISTAYYARYPLSELHPCLSASLRIADLTENSVESESQIVARITGDKLLAVPMREMAQEIRDRLARISPERQVELTKQYADLLLAEEEISPVDLPPATSVDSTDPDRVTHPEQLEPPGDSSEE